MKKFRDLVREYINEVSEVGFPDAPRMEYFLAELRKAAEREFISDDKLNQAMRGALETSFKRATSPTRLKRTNPGIERFTVERLKPTMRQELDRRIMANANMIKINRQQAIDKTLQRFSGWMSSVPKGGTDAINKTETLNDITKTEKQLKYEARRREIDQGHKLMASIDALIAEQTGAIAGEWHSHVNQPGYDARKDHAERNKKVYAIRNSWAYEQGLINKGAGFTDEMTAPAEEVNCFPGETLINFFDDAEKVYRRPYEGSLVTITLCSGAKLSATPNHPVLSKNGWIAIGLLNEGDDIFEVCQESVEPSCLYANQALPMFSDLFDAVSTGRIKEIRSGMKPYFHGDGTSENIDIVTLTGPLRSYRKPGFLKRLNIFSLAFSDIFGLAERLVMKNLNRFFLSSYGSMSGIQRLSVIGCNDRVERTSGCFASAQSTHNTGFAHSKNFPNFRSCFAGIIGIAKRIVRDRNFILMTKTFTKIDPSLLMPVPNGHDGHIKLGCNLADGRPITAKPVKVISIDRRPWSGHVYNLQTDSGWYVANQIITHNCRCFYTYYKTLRDLPPDMLTVKGKNLLNGGSDAI